MKFFSNIKNTKGFTLIELLIVVAIIAILSTVVLASLGSSRKNAKAAKARTEMASMRAQAELFASNNSNLYATSGSITVPNMFTTASSSNGLKDLADAVTAGGYTIISGVSSSAWAAYITLDTSKFFCVDSNGFSGELSAAPSVATTYKCL